MKATNTLSIGLLAASVFSVQASLVIPTVGVASTIDFTGFDGSGFTPTPGAGQLDSDTWSTSGFDTNVSFGGTGTTDDPARGSSTGGVGTGGIYSFDVGSGNATLGVQPGGSDFTPGYLALRVNNDTGSLVTQLNISYTIYVYNDQGRGNSFNFSHSDDDSTYTGIGALDYTSAETAAGSPAWVAVNRSTSITGLSIADGANYYFRWNGEDVSGSGSRDQFALDDISITAQIPEPAIALLGGLGILGILRRRR